MSRHLVIFAATVLSLVHAVAFGSESRNIGTDTLHATGTSERNLTYTPSQEVSIYYENNIAYPRWDYANNAKAHKAIVKTIEELSAKQRNIIIIIKETKT